MKKFGFTKAGVLGLVLGFSVAAVVVNAAVTNVFSSGDPIVAADVNSNFSELDIRLAALEAKSALVGQAGRMAYLWANVASQSGEYEPSSVYSYNSSGGMNTVSSSVIGHYTVIFSGMEPDGADGGNVQVTAYNHAVSCGVDQWLTPAGTTDVVVSISCFNGSGVFVNS